MTCTTLSEVDIGLFILNAMPDTLALFLIQRKADMDKLCVGHISTDKYSFNFIFFFRNISTNMTVRCRNEYGNCDEKNCKSI